MRQSRDGVDRRDLERFFEGQRGQDAAARRSPSSSCRTGRSASSDVVSAGRRDLQRALAQRCPRTSAKSPWTFSGGAPSARRHAHRMRIVQRGHRLGERSHGIEVRPVDDGRLLRVGDGQQQAATRWRRAVRRSAGRRAPPGCRRRATARRGSGRRHVAPRITPAAASTPSAIGRSNDAPPFARRPARG
jgi:hypothetical protein